MSFLSDKYLAITIGDVEIDISREKKTATKSPGSGSSPKPATYLMGVIRGADEKTLILDKSTITGMSKDVGDLVPEGLTINVKNGVVAKASKADVLGANLGVDIDLSDLPIAGKMFPKGETLTIENLQLLMATQVVAHAGAEALNGILPPGVADFPYQLNEGVNFSATFNLDGYNITLGTATLAQLNAEAQKANGGMAAPATNKSAGKVGKSFGPIHIQSVDLGFSGGDLVVTMDASVSFGPLTLSFYKLQIASPISAFHPSFDLQGLSLDYHKKNVSIEGTFLNAGGGEYSGMFSLDLTELQLTAIGSYKNDNGSPSLFIYGLLNQALGGPPAFFVEGVAVAFGYNRNFIAPPVTGISTFPLVSAAFNGTPQQSASGLETMMQTLDKYIPPKPGEYFAGIGLKFMSFKVINSFALLIVKFGDELEFDLLGESTYVAPNPQAQKPIAVVQLELVGSYKPSAGTLLIRGQLTPSSYVLSKNCHLEGGFAIANWFKGPYDGDFVYTFGGYSSRFKVPNHYPKNIPKLGFLWQVASDVSIKGGGYWAITPKELMVGGYLLAAYSTSEIRASFNIDAYFKINWSPLHYQASFNVTFSLSVYIDLLFVSGWLGFELSEGLAIHGPSFGGTAYIDLAVATVHINFGASPKPEPLLSGEEFRKGFLPESSALEGLSNILSLNIEKGLVKKVENVDGTKEIHVINPKELHISTKSFVPSTSFNGLTTSGTGTPFEITPMGIVFDGSTYHSTHSITIIPKDKSDTISHFSVIPSSPKHAPKAIWQEHPLSTDYDDEAISPLSFGTDITLHEDTGHTGISITPEVPRKTLANEKFQGAGFKWETVTPFMNKSDVIQPQGVTTLSGTSIAPSTYESLDEVFDFGSANRANHDGLSNRLKNMKTPIFVGTRKAAS